MINATREFQRFLISSSVFLLVIFIILMIQNMIRYGIHQTYNPWKSVLYLSISLVIFVGLIPPFYRRIETFKGQSQAKFYAFSAIIICLTLFVFFAISNMVLFLSGYYDHWFDPLYASRYFGREALFHLLVLCVGAYYIRQTKTENRILVSGTLGRKEITIEPGTIKWIETDDHYLKIHTIDNSLIKRATMDQMAEELGSDFIRIHRKYLVNKSLIKGKEKLKREEFVLLQSGERLKVGRSYTPLSWH